MSTETSFSLPAKLASTISKRLSERALFDEPIAPYVAYRVGGPADVLVFPEDEQELSWICELARSSNIPLTTIGTGTNLLVRDEGIRGITISLRKAFQEIRVIQRLDSGEGLIRCGGGVEKPAFLDWAIKNGWTGLEFSSGVPGTIGGGIFMNAGTKYGCYGDIIERLRLFKFNEGSHEYAKEEIHFGYRQQSLVNKDTLVCWADFRLHPGKSNDIQREVDRIVRERAEKQPLDYPSCGSTFKNPEGYSAGRLIEKAGLKGSRVGGAEISTKHANFILNKGSAEAKDILKLIQLIKKEVYSKFGVHLECEVIVVGGPHA